MGNNKVLNNCQINCESALARLKLTSDKADLTGYIDLSESLLSNASDVIGQTIGLLNSSDCVQALSFGNSLVISIEKNELLPKFTLDKDSPVLAIPYFIHNTKDDFKTGEMELVYYWSFIDELYNSQLKPSILPKILSFALIFDYFKSADSGSIKSLKKYLYDMSLDTYLANLISYKLDESINTLFGLIQTKDLLLHKALKDISLEAGLNSFQYRAFESSLILNTVDCISLDDLLPKNKKLSAKDVKFLHSEQKLLSVDSKLLHREQRLRILAFSLLESRNLNDFIASGFMVHGVTTASFYKEYAKTSDKDYLKNLVNAIQYVKSYENWWSDLELSSTRLLFALQTNTSIAKSLDKTLNGICFKGNIRHFENLVSLAVNLKGITDVIDFNSLNMYLLQATTIINFNITDMNFNISKLLKVDFIKDVDSLITESEAYYLALCHKERYMPYAFRILSSNYFNAVNFKRGFLQVGHSVFRFVKHTQDLFDLSVELGVNVEKYYPDIDDQKIVILHGRIADDSVIGLIFGVDESGLFLKESLLKKNKEQSLISKKATNSLLDKILVKKMYLLEKGEANG